MKVTITEPKENYIIQDDNGGIGGAPLYKTGGTPAVASGIPAYNPSTMETGKPGGIAFARLFEDKEEV